MRENKKGSRPAKDRQARAVPDVAIDEHVRRLIERSTAAQGLPFHVQDEATLARVAVLVQVALRKKPADGSHESA
jgi:hypothetical protein